MPVAGLRAAGVLDRRPSLMHHPVMLMAQGKWQLVRSDDGRMLTIPPTVTFGPSPRGPD